MKKWPNVANRHRAKKEEADTYGNLSRYYGALGNEQLTLIYMDKALLLYEQLGDTSGIIYTKMAKLEQSLSYRKVEDVLPEMNALLAEVKANRDTTIERNLRIRLVGITLGAKLFDEAEEHIAALEQLPVSDPIRPSEYGIVSTAAMGRAELAMARNDLDNAECYFQKVLWLAETKPDPWVEIHVLNSLGALEWERHNAALAKSYLDRAHTKAEKLGLDGLLTVNYALKARIAEAEGRFADALEFSKKERAYDEKFKSRSAGFNMQSYYLQLANERLASETRHDQLELDMRKIQLRNSLIIIGLVLLLAIGLFIGLFKHRKGMRDLAAQNRLLQHQAEQLKNLDAAKSRFFANVSHELRTPLQLISGPVSYLLKQPWLSHEQIGFLKMAKRGGEQLQQLVDEILDLRKMEMGQMKLHEEPTLIAAFFGMLTSQFESLAHQKGTGFSVRIECDDECSIHFDREKFRQILHNLLSNAFKFTGAGDMVQASLAIRNDHLYLSVKDNGRGIHPDDVPHVFDRYFQSSRPDRPAERGTGIGLALCHEYARLFGGDITVESTIGKGSVFEFRCPVRFAETPPQETEKHDDANTRLLVKEKQKLAPQTPASLVREEASSMSKPTILLVEDNPDLQQYMCMLLSSQYRVVTASHGREALEILSPLPASPREGEVGLSPSPLGRAREGLIISDLMMPIMDGYQLLEKLKSDDATRHIPVIMLTARAEARDRLKALRIGVDDYLTKPFEQEELLVRISNLLKNQTSRQKEAAFHQGEEFVTSKQSVKDLQWLETFENFVKGNLSDTLLCIPMLAQEFAMSESTLLRQLKRLTGLTPNQYLQEIRLEQARLLLENRTHNSVSNVASKVGYIDTRSFSRRYKKRFGKLPSEYLPN